MHPAEQCHASPGLQKFVLKRVSLQAHHELAKPDLTGHIHTQTRESLTHSLTHTHSNSIQFNSPPDSCTPLSREKCFSESLQWRNTTPCTINNLFPFPFHLVFFTVSLSLSQPLPLPLPLPSRQNPTLFLILPHSFEAHPRLAIFFSFSEYISRRKAKVVSCYP
ncbi:hypothetical protein VNO78_31372 [Psophocarpus tetragonolobus]|uniref:Uncharacterized protein n=1 Tax=Psophocarpus tetragonolobus TaxID=3891 RepID=A0AAN9RYB0_PSOTE